MDKKLKNELFKVAVDYLFKEKKVGSQKELADRIGITEPSLSRIMNNKRFVSDDTLRKMNESFGGIFNMAYFRGEDPHCMLMEDLAYYKQHPEERLVFEKPNGDNPSLGESANAVPASSPIDLSSIMNAALSAQMETIEHLKQTITDMKEQYLRELEEKDAHILDLTKLAEERLHRIAELRRIIDANNTSTSDFIFPIGTAEKQTHKHI